MSLLDEAVAAAGVDPRELHATLTAAQPDRTIQLARAFEDAAQSARQAYESGRTAHGTIAGGFHNNGTAVLDAEAADRQAWQLLGQGGQDMEDTAALLKRSVAALDEAQGSSATAITRMTTEVNDLAAAWNRQVGPPSPGAREQLVAAAAAVVRRAATDVERAIRTYDAGLAGAAGELAGRGYTAPDTALARYEGGAGTPLAAPGTPGVPVGDKYRGLSPANGLFTAGDVLGGLNGARLEVDAHYQGANGALLKEAAEGDLARLRGQERVLNPSQFYDDLDHAATQLRSADGVIKGAESTSRASKVLPIKVGGAMALAGIGYDIATGKDPVQAVASGGGGFLASIAAGAATGAVVGTFVPVPGVGTAVGAVVGAGVGIFTSGAIDSLFENGPDVGAAASRGGEAVLDTGKAVVHGVASVGKGIAGLFD
jgi:hypothetical protein